MQVPPGSPGPHLAVGLKNSGEDEKLLRFADWGVDIRFAVLNVHPSYGGQRYKEGHWGLR